MIKPNHQHNALSPKKSVVANQKGMAIVESIPLIVIFIMLLMFSLGLFGVIHTATLHSIGARAYAFETFRNRTNLHVFRENPGPGQGLLSHTSRGRRFHAIGNSKQNNDGTQEMIATPRPIGMGNYNPPQDSTEEKHNQQIFNLPVRNENIGVSPALIMVGYGICLEASCGS